MGYEVEEIKPVKGTKSHLKAMAELEVRDVRNMSLFSILWHLICRYKKVWFWMSLVIVGYILGFLRVGL